MGRCMFCLGGRVEGSAIIAVAWSMTCCNHTMRLLHDWAFRQHVGPASATYIPPVVAKGSRAKVSRYHQVFGRANVGSLIVRNLDDELILRLKEQAKQAGRSAEAEHRSILEQALRPRRSGRELWERLSRGEKADLDFGAGVDQTIKGADFS
jgi:plasmid stability protein